MVNNLIVCGGTFDHFHKGHEKFLEYALFLGKKIIIGLTSDNYIKDSKSGIKNLELIESFKKRKKAVSEFIEKKNASSKVEIIKINDLFGPTLKKVLLIDGIAVSCDTRKGAEIINQRRRKLGLSPLKVFIVPSIKAEDGELISSEKIRSGKISRRGKLFIKSVWLKEDLFLPEDLREEFKKPFGIFGFDVSRHQSQSNWIVSVGDVTTKNLNQLSVNQKISVVDFKIARKKTFSSFSELGFFGDEKVIIAENPAGHITQDLFSKILSIFETNFKKRIILKVEGEEDLAVLPLILAAPLDVIIYYGQPGQGIMRVEVSEKIKEIAFRLVDEFKVLE